VLSREGDAVETPKMSFQGWVEAQIKRFGTARKLAGLLATALKVPEFDEGKISRWRRNNLLPLATEIPALAEVTGTPLEEILLMVWDADRRRVEARTAHLNRSKPPAKAGGRLHRGNYSPVYQAG
jgi:hypothetical protein